jgi:hypothetical protein
VDPGIDQETGVIGIQGILRPVLVRFIKRITSFMVNIDLIFGIEE